MFEDELIFWGLFLAFNYLQFLPSYIININRSDFLPYLDFFRGKKIGFFANRNKDFFRYLIDISLLILLIKFNFFDIPLFLIAFYYTGLFIFNIYHHLFWTLYETYPTFYNDWSLLKTGLSILWKESSAKVLISSMILILISVFVYFSFYRYLIFVSGAGIYLFDWIITVILLIVFISAIIINYLIRNKTLQYIDHDLRFVIGFIRFIYNIKFSLDYMSFENKFKSLQKEKIREIPSFKLRAKPNIYFLFIESYGSVLLYNEILKEKFRPNYEIFKSELKKEKWEMVSAISSAPTTSAFSWLCYATFFYGYNISQHTHYENFLRNPLFHKSDNLMKVLRDQGYTTFFLNPIQPNPNVSINYEYLTPFYAVDRWILFEDMEYTGDRYGFSEAPPDQFSINKASEIIEREGSYPFVLFFLTKNSHSPFASPHYIIDDWRSLNHPDGRTYYGGGFLKRPEIQNYIRAIHYQLYVIKDFIQRRGKDTDLFFIMGDHQPVMINSREKYGLGTPVHIISKNNKFLEGFYEYGFRKSLFDESISSLKHEALYSVFLREFIKCFGIDYKELPPYEPDGLQI